MSDILWLYPDFKTANRVSRHILVDYITAMDYKQVFVVMHAQMLLNGSPSPNWDFYRVTYALEPLEPYLTAAVVTWKPNHGQMMSRIVFGTGSLALVQWPYDRYPLGPFHESNFREDVIERFVK